MKWGWQSRLFRLACTGDSLLRTFPAPAPPGAWPDLGAKAESRQPSRTEAGTQLGSQSGAWPWPGSGSGSSVAWLCDFGAKVHGASKAALQTEQG